MQATLCQRVRVPKILNKERASTMGESSLRPCTTTNKHMQARTCGVPECRRCLTALELWAYTICPLFFLLFTDKPYSINSRGIQLVSSHNQRQDRDLQSLIFRSLIWYILHVLWYSALVGFFKPNASTFLKPFFVQVVQKSRVKLCYLALK